MVLESVKPVVGVPDPAFADGGRWSSLLSPTNAAINLVPRVGLSTDVSHAIRKC